MDNPNEMRSHIMKALEGTPYECWHLAPMSGGSVNFVFRGDLSAPAPCDPYMIAIVKKYTNRLSCSSNFEIDLSRCVRISLSRQSFRFPD